MNVSNIMPRTALYFIVVILVLGMFCSCQKQTGFIVTPAPIYSRKQYKVVPNPFVSMHHSNLASIFVTYETGEEFTITNKTQISQVYTAIRDVEFVDGWVTLNGPGFISEQQFRDQFGKVLAFTAVNTDDGEIVLRRPGLILGVGKNLKFWDLVNTIKNELAPP